MLKNYFISILIFSLFSCAKKENIIPFQTTVQPFNWPSWNILKQNYRSFHKQGDKIIFYEPVQHRFLHLNLENHLLDSVKLEFNGPNGIGEVSQFYHVNKDTILALDPTGQIYILDDLGNLKKHLNLIGLQESFNGDIYANFPDLGFTNKLIYLPKKNSLLIYHQKFDDEKEKNIFSLINLNTGTIEVLPIRYPENISSGKINPYLLDLEVEIHDDGFFWIFSGDPTLYKYSFKERKIFTSVILPNFSKTWSDPPSLKTTENNEIRSFIRENPFYGKLIFDPVKRLLYRISVPPMTYLPDDQSLYSFNKVFVSIMDENLNLVSQGYLKKENTYNFNFSFDYKGGLWIAYQEDLQDDESLIKGDLIQFPKIFGERTSGSN